MYRDAIAGADSIPDANNHKFHTFVGKLTAEIGFLGLLPVQLPECSPQDVSQGMQVGLLAEPLHQTQPAFPKRLTCIYLIGKLL